MQTLGKYTIDAGDSSPHVTRLYSTLFTSSFLSAMETNLAVVIRKIEGRVNVTRILNAVIQLYLSATALLRQPFHLQ